MLPEPADAMATYAELRARLTDLLGDVSDERAAEIVVPACPEWTVTDTVAHLNGVCVDILGGNLAEAGTKAWADEHVSRSADVGLTGLLEQWGTVAPSVIEIGPAFPPQAAAQFVFDATTHEHDIRGALDLPGGRDAGSVLVGLAFLEATLDQYVRELELPTVKLTTPVWSTVAGDGEPQVEVEASAFELLRSFGGRRSADQVRSLAWTGDPTPYLGLLDGDRAIAMRTDALVE